MFLAVARRRLNTGAHRWATSGDASDGEEGPFSRETLEDMRSAILESNAGPCDEVFDGVRHEDLTGTGRRGDARSDVDRDAADLLTDDLALAGMQAAADLQVQRAHLVANPACTAYGASRAVERGEEPVAGGVDLPPAEPRELAPCRAVVLPEQLAPTAIADRARARWTRRYR